MTGRPRARHRRARSFSAVHEFIGRPIKAGLRGRLMNAHNLVSARREDWEGRLKTEELCGRLIHARCPRAEQHYRFIYGEQWQGNFGAGRNRTLEASSGRRGVLWRPCRVGGCWAGRGSSPALYYCHAGISRHYQALAGRKQRHILNGDPHHSHPPHTHRPVHFIDLFSSLESGATLITNRGN